ncbi:MAG: tetratricopeptide repeat protein [Rhodospirillales bacterium]|jgi:tetratricopeptide (TPR) repeat protein|nr:tetratricopeptide repeat protein [Rhodospirillales bacterium]
MSGKVEYTLGTSSTNEKTLDVSAIYDQGVALRETGQQEQAIKCFLNVLALDEKHARAHGNLGLSLADLGRFDEGQKHYLKAVELDPNYGEAWRGLANTGYFDTEPTQLLKMDDAFNITDVPAEDRIHLGFGLAKVYEDLHRYDEAFSCLKTANRLKRDSISFDIEKSAAMVQSLIKHFDRSLFNHHTGSGRNDKTPIFVLGMPRSGTTLVEQILASHPTVHGAGEQPYVEATLNNVFKKYRIAFPAGLMKTGVETFHILADEYLEKLRSHDEEADRITDKMLGNFMLIGLIHLMLPNAKIVHVRRDPLDNCFSIYSRLFAKTHLYSYDLEELATFYGLYRSLMDHWHTVLPGCMLDFSYEALITDPEQQTKNLLAYCDLPFDERCLRPHQTKRTILTASNFQVRQPINTASIERWRNFEPHLDSLQESLREFLE